MIFNNAKWVMADKTWSAPLYGQLMKYALRVQVCGTSFSSPTLPLDLSSEESGTVWAEYQNKNVK